MKPVKPHIVKVQETDLWVCASGRWCGFGMTPLEAFQAWQGCIHLFPHGMPSLSDMQAQERVTLH